MTVAVAPIDGEIVDESLSDLAARANDYHAQALDSADTALRCAMLAGQELIKAKASPEIKHGDWLPWLRANFNGSQQSASNYTILASNYQSVSNLPLGMSISGALRKIKASQNPPSQGRRSGATRFSKTIQLLSASIADECEKLTDDEVAEALGAAQFLYELLRGETIIRNTKKGE